MWFPLPGLGSYLYSHPLKGLTLFFFYLLNHHFLHHIKKISNLKAATTITKTYLLPYSLLFFVWNLLGEKSSLHLLSLFSYLQLICNSLKCGFHATTLLSNCGKGRPEIWLPNAPCTHSWCHRPLSFWSWHPLSWLLFHLSHDPSSVSFDIILPASEHQSHTELAPGFLLFCYPFFLRDPISLGSATT